MLLPRRHSVPAFPGRLALSVEEAAAAIGVSRRALDEALLRGEFPSVVIRGRGATGGRRVVPLEAFVRALNAPAKGEG